MILGWLKHLAPRGLYGRAALILIVPIVTIQLVMSVVFIQRHYEGVTEQMTRNIAAGLRYLLDEVEEAPDAEAAASAIEPLLGPLAIRATLPLGAARPPPARDLRDGTDFTGRTVIATLRAELDGLRGIDLVTGRREARVWLETRHGLMLVVLDRSRMQASNPHQLLVIVIFTAILMTVIAFLFLRNQVRPIRRLAAAAEALGKGRHVTYRPQGALEVRAAGRAFLQMRDRLERHIESRTRMLSSVSHDLRTPITRMKLALALQDEGPESDALLRDVDEMERLVDSFLDYARGEALDDVVPTDPVALVRDAVEKALRGGHRVEMIAPAGAATDAATDAGTGTGTRTSSSTGTGAEAGAGARGARTGAGVRSAARPGAGVEVQLRPQLLARALDNLIGNAARYGTRAEVSVRVDPRAVVITVEDDGPGIPEAQRADALKPFTRLDLSRNQNRGAGVGLGLAIVADAVRGHGGALTLGGSARLGGLKATIRLPR